MKYRSWIKWGVGICRKHILDQGNKDQTMLAFGSLKINCGSFQENIFASIHQKNPSFTPQYDDQKSKKNFRNHEKYYLS